MMGLSGGWGKPTHMGMAHEAGRPRFWVAPAILAVVKPDYTLGRRHAILPWLWPAASAP